MPLKSQCVASELHEVAADLLAIAVFSSDSIATSKPIAALDHALSGSLSRLATRDEFTGKKDQVLELDTLGHLPAQRVLLFGLGKRGKVRGATFRVFAARAARAANAVKASSLALSLPTPPDPEKMRRVGEGVVLGAYRFSKYLTGDRKPKSELTEALVVVPKKAGGTARLQRALELGTRLGSCVCYTRDLVNEPPNELTPVRLASFAQRVAKQHGLSCRVLNKAQIEKAGMTLLLAVAQGSSNEPRFVHMVYKPAKAAKRRLVVVGKGLTFDSGGLCIKPAQGMGEMKSDMSGAGNVVGFMAAVAELKPSLEVHGIIAAAENMPDGNAYRPGDVFGSLDGKTVEIINTDAEGRLVLADALAYARELEPSALICNATLTGACVVALGQKCSAYYATTNKLASQFGKAAQDAGEQFWHMPLLEDLREQLKSDVADLKHMGDRWGGSISAALFLREFVGEAPFIHCDIAGPALADKAYNMYTKGGTGQGVLAFLQFAETLA